MAALRKQEARTKLCHSTTSGDTHRWVLRWHRKSSTAINRMCSWPVAIFALTKTSAFWSKRQQDSFNLFPAGTEKTFTIHKRNSCKHRRWGITYLYHHGSLTLTIDHDTSWVIAEGEWELKTLAQVCLVAITKKITSGSSATAKISVAYSFKASSKITESKLPADYCRVCVSPE